MNKLMSFMLTVVAVALAGCQSKPQVTPPPPSQPLDAAALESLRSSLGSDTILAGVARVLPSEDFLALSNADTSKFAVSTPVSIIDSSKNTLAHGKVVAIVQGEVHVQFSVSGPRRPQVGDAAIGFPRH